MSEPLRIGIAGLGTVGAGLVRLIETNREAIAERCDREIVITGVCARDRSKDRGVDLSSYTWFDDPVALARSNAIDVFVELIGGDDGAAYQSVATALEQATPVVTANKALLALHGAELGKKAEENHVSLAFEAAVAGGIPIVKSMRESLAGNVVSRVYGILNGTCNYILTTMERDGREFDDVLAEAQALGYAEADPSFDVGGIDAAHKLALLTSLAFGTEVDFDSVYVEGIESITAADIASAADFGYRIKLLGVAQRTEFGIEQRVHPTLVPRGSAIAEVGDVFNAVVVEGNCVGEVMLFGRGAGAGPTASAVAGDLIDLARGQSGTVFGRPAETLKPYERARMRAHEGGYYVGLSVYDRPGAMAAIAQRMADEMISLQSISQRTRDPRAGEAEPDDAPPAAVTLITHETTEAAIRSAIAKIEQDGHIAGHPRMIRIEPT